MMTGMKRFFATILAVALVTACGDRATRSDERTDVRVYLGSAPASLSLIGKTDTRGGVLAEQISDSLLQYDAEMKLVPRVAESWEHSADGKDVVFRIREGVRWHDGAPVRAADVVHTIEMVSDPAVESRGWSFYFEELESIEAVDDRTVRARYRTVGPDDYAGWRVPLVPAHLTGTRTEILEGDFARHPVGCGPFRFVERVEGERIVLAANDDHWAGRPVIDRLVFFIYPDHRTAYQALRTGDLDVAHVVPDLYAEALDGDPELRGFILYKPTVWQLYWNQREDAPWFHDKRVRRALLMSLDRATFNAERIGGLAGIGTGMIPPGTRYHDPGVEPPVFDPDGARRLLDEAGWRDSDGDGVRERGDVSFAVELLIANSSMRLNDDMAAWIQQSWREVGVALSVRKLEWQAYRKERNAGGFDVTMGTLTLDGPDLTPVLHSASTELYNFFHFVDEETDRLLDEARRELDVERRAKLYSALQRRLGELVPTGPLFHFPTPVLVRTGLAGVTPSPLGHLRAIGGPASWRWEPRSGR